MAIACKLFETNVTVYKYSLYETNRYTVVYETNILCLTNGITEIKSCSARSVSCGNTMKCLSGCIAVGL
jgi:hypothetical protein